MRWYVLLANFWGGVALANSVPHFVNGISGHAFPTPFSPAGGASSPTVNVLWGFFHFAIGYLLVCRVGSFSVQRTRQVVVVGAGILLMALYLASVFGGPAPV
jgi:uncharacterized PurR-regulated membrane protein YhhQ (DUF165 family)